MLRSGVLIHAIISVGFPLLGGCRNVQAVLSPAGPTAAAITELSLVLFGGATLIFIIIMALVLHSVYSAPLQFNQRRWIIGGGIIFPIVVLMALLIYSVSLTGKMAAPAISNHSQHVTYGFQ